jgi:hypothetical protein
MMRRHIATGLLVAALVLPDRLSACSCPIPDYHPAAVNEAADKADVVFKGKVVHVQEVSIPTYAEPVSFNTGTMTVLQVVGTWKVPDAAEVYRIAVFSGDGRADCGFRFEVGQSYVVFGTYSQVYVPEALNTNMCTLTRKLPESHGIEAALGKPQPPPPDPFAPN